MLGRYIAAAVVEASKYAFMLQHRLLLFLSSFSSIRVFGRAAPSPQVPYVPNKKFFYLVKQYKRASKLMAIAHTIVLTPTNPTHTPLPGHPLLLQLQSRTNFFMIAPDEYEHSL